MKKITIRNLPDNIPKKIYEYSKEEIINIRLRENLTRPAFAKYLNVKTSLIEDLEKGRYQAKGAILKLITLFDKKGKNFLL